MSGIVYAPRIELDRASSTPVYEQIAQPIEAAISSVNWAPEP